MTSPQRGAPGDAGFTARWTRAVLIGLAVIATALLLWRIREVLLLGFAAVVLAVFLLSITDGLRRHTPLPHGPALAIAVLLLLAGVGLLAALAWSPLQTQVVELSEGVAGAVRRLEAAIGISLADSLEPDRGAEDAAKGWFGGLGGLVTTAFSATRSVFATLSGVVLVVVTGVYLAASPSVYREGLVKLFPRSQHTRIRDALGKSGAALRQWMIGQAIAMLIVGTSVGAGAWLLGLPAPFALGVFAGLVEFVPIVGPLVGAVPALLLAFQVGPGLLLWTAVLFLAVQQVESNLITPLVQKRMVSIPPALFILSLAALGSVFGVVGVLISAPATVVLFVLVRHLYVRQTLGAEVASDRDGAG